MKSCQFNKSHWNKIYILYHEWCIHWDSGLSVYTSFVHELIISWICDCLLLLYLCLPLTLIRSSHRRRMQNFNSFPLCLRNTNKAAWSPWVTSATLTSIFLVTYSQSSYKCTAEYEQKTANVAMFCIFPHIFQPQ